MQELIGLLNDWRPVWLCGAGLCVLGIMRRLLKETIDDFRGGRTAALIDKGATCRHKSS